jgi:SSS family solute:Na+ symporter
MTTDIVVFSIYITLLLILGWKAKIKNPTQEEYLLSNRSLTLPALVATLVTTWYGGILGIGEFIYYNGISTWVIFGLPYYFFAFLFAFFLAPKIRSGKYMSIPDLLYQRYGRTAGFIGSIFVMFITSPAPYILITGILITYMLGLPLIAAVILAALFSVIYVFKGGFSSVVQTDKLQFLLMFGGFLLLFTFLVADYGSPAHYYSQLNKAQQSFSGGLSFQSVFVWFLIASWTFIDPGFHQRTAAARSPKTAKDAILISIVFWFIFDMLTLWTGIYAVTILQNTEPLMIYPQIAERVLPPLIKSIFLVGLLATAMSTTDSFSFISAQTFGRDIIAFLNRKNSDKEVAHYTQIGLFLTVVIALVMIWIIPSVVKMWYTLGSLFIPPLLIPIVSGLFDKKNISKNTAITIMLISFAFTFAWFISGIFNDNKYPWGIEPFVPGLITSILIYLFRKKRVTHSAEH